ncbi:hypothetical protein [Georgenia satyanarayanai]|uniref:hypothetical protein n=1 Tax=Georgenia satyanarayanai TaxID=860221 RepID=UPI000DA10EE4|nr:hypothetical protein [Georgenia satyanarayanai]
MATSSWHRWQLTAPLAALSRPVRTPHATTGPVAVADAGEPADGLPVLLGGARARQVDATTCGSAVLVMLAATGDPALAQWLETGQLPAGPRPPEVPHEDVPGGAAERFAAAQQRVKAATGRRALGPLPWPAGLGTPPWTAAREARFPGVRYRVRPVDDTTEDGATVLGLVEAANRRGHPVPLYTGGDVRGGLAHAVPRHVVLAVPPPSGAAVPGTLRIYEPSRGSVLTVPSADLLGRTEPLRALGGWTHVVAALLPVPA